MKHWLITFALICVFSVSRLGKADYDEPELGAAGVLADQYLPHHPEDADHEDEDHEHHVGVSDEDHEHHVGVSDEDPAHIVNKALLCFNDKHIYSSCDESYRLTVNGNLNVPPEYTDEYCDGPCTKETHLLLSCIEGILSHFRFYNKATIFDVRETIKTGCSFGPKRGDFNVLEHIEAHEDNAQKASYTFFCGLALMIMTCLLLI